MVSTIQLVSFVVWVIIGLKIMYISSSLMHKYNHFNKNSFFYKYDDMMVWLKEVTEFAFVLLMCLLLIFIFHPGKQNIGYMTKEIKLLIYMFAWIMIVTANWKDFFNLIKR